MLTSFLNSRIQEFKVSRCCDKGCIKVIHPSHIRFEVRERENTLGKLCCFIVLQLQFYLLSVIVFTKIYVIIYYSDDGIRILVIVIVASFMVKKQHHKFENNFILLSLLDCKIMLNSILLYSLSTKPEKFSSITSPTLPRRILYVHNDISMQSPKTIAAKLQAVTYATNGSVNTLFDCAKVGILFFKNTHFITLFRRSLTMLDPLTTEHCRFFNLR